MSNLANSGVILKFTNSVLAQKNSSSLYSNFIFNFYIVCELNNWPRNPTYNFPPKNCLFGRVKLVKNAVKSKVIYDGRPITFDGESSYSFGNDFDRNVVIFVVDNSSSSHTKNRKNNFLVFGEGPADVINDSTDAAKKKVRINLSKANKNFCISLHNNDDESYLNVNKTEIYKYKLNDITSWCDFSLESVSKDFAKEEQSEVSLNGTAHNFSVDHSSIIKRHT